MPEIRSIIEEQKMEHHPYFDLWLHKNEELGKVTGGAIIERVTLHEWPLSCVQRLTCADGRTFIYKVQSQPTVEPEFYQQARSPLLVRSQVLPVDGLPPALLLEDVRAPRLSDLGLSPAEAVRAADVILDGIAGIKGDLPALLDIRTGERWLAHSQKILANLRALVEQGSFTRVTPAMIERVAGHSLSADVLAAVENGPTGFVHSDLFAENILAPQGGYMVLDWQRPIWGPVGLDRAALLGSLGVALEEHLPPGLLRLRTLLSIDWLAQAARFWFPPGVETYDQQIARLIEQLEP